MLCPLCPIMKGRWLPAAFALTALALIGCGGPEGPPRAAVRGSVSLDGQPLASGMIRFIPSGDTQGPAAVAPITAGSYELDASQGPLVGLHRVEIEATDYFGFAIDDEAAFAAQIEQQRRRPPANPVPPVYNRHSTLTASVAPGEINELHYTLDSKSAQTAQR